MANEPALDDVVVRRLIFVRYLHSLAVRQSRLPEPLRTVSLLMFHDALELFFDVAIAHRKMPRPKPRAEASMFGAYFEALNEKIAPSRLPDHASLERLNKARVSFKHYGIMPSGLDLESYRGTTTSFLQASTLLLFGIEFDAISLSDLVVTAKARELLHDAEALFAEDGKSHDALAKLAPAFDDVLANFEGGLDPFSFGRPMPRVRKNWLRHDQRNDQAFEDFLNDVTRSVDEIQKVRRMLAIGIDVKRYRRFSRITARASMQGAPITSEQFQYCRDFIVELALALQQFGAELDEVT